MIHQPRRPVPRSDGAALYTMADTPTPPLSLAVLIANNPGMRGVPKLSPALRAALRTAPPNTPPAGGTKRPPKR